MFENAKYVSSGKFISRGQWIHPDRIINSYEIIFVINGTVFITENDTEYVLKKNDILVLSPDIRHFGHKSSTDTSFYWIHWTSDAFLLNRKNIHIDTPFELSLLFNQILHYSNDNYFPECLDYITRLILAAVYHIGDQSPDSKLANSVAQWIKNNEDMLIKASDISEHFGYNADYLSRLFKKYYKKSLKQYIDDTKLQFIKTQLLNSNYTLKEISNFCGFTDYKYFLKFFKYHVGMTPTEFLNTYYKTHTNNK